MSWSRKRNRIKINKASKSEGKGAACAAPPSILLIAITRRRALKWIKTGRGGGFITRKSKFITAAYLLVLAWLIVSAWFFCRHYLTVKNITVDEVIALENGLLHVHQITLENFQRQSIIGRNSWQYKVAEKLPGYAIFPFFRICHFYSRPYAVNENYGRVKVKGFYILDPEAEANQNKNLFDQEDLCDQLDVRLTSYVVNFTNRFRTRYYSDSEIVFFQAYGDHFPLDAEKFKLELVNKSTGTVRELVFRHSQWQEETFNTFAGKPYLEYANYLRYTFDKIYDLLGNGQEDEVIEKWILPAARESFPWERVRHKLWQACSYYGSLGYEGDYLDFKRVYSWNVVFKKPAGPGKGLSEQPTLARQKLYFIFHAGELKLVGAGGAKGWN